jgi:hypothetical protein
MEAMMKFLITSAVIFMMIIVPAATEPSAKSKGKAACESLKTATLCESKQGCDWAANPGSKAKCRTLKAAPR